MLLQENNVKTIRQVKWRNFLTLYIWCERDRDGWLGRGDVGSSKCQINHFYWPLPLENVDLCSSPLLITHHKSTIHGCVWMCVFSVPRDRKKATGNVKSIDRRCTDDTVQVDLVFRMQFGRIWFEITFPLNDLLHRLPTSCLEYFLVLLCSKCLCECSQYQVPQSTMSLIAPVGLLT